MLEMLRDFFQEVGEIILTGEAIVLGVGALLGALAMFFVMWYVFEVVADWRIFKKAGEGGWKSLIPVYNSYIRYKISWRPLWFWISAGLFIASVALGCFTGESAVLDGIALAVTAVSVLIRVAGLYHLARAFDRGVGFTVGLVLFRPLFILILGLGGAEYRGVAAERAGEVQ